MFELRAQDPSALYHPFANECDWGIASLFTKFKTTKGCINNFARDPRLCEMTKHCSFRNGNELEAKIHEIPWGSRDDGWTRAVIKLDTNVADMESTSCTVYFCDVIQVLRFLLGHGPFKDNLTYAPERHYISTDSTRVYSEMHTGDWWWSLQEQLGEGATVVPLLLATDKTMLTQHRGDLTMWPVYITIGNLDVATRKSQTRPSMVLLGLIPAAKLGKEHHREMKSAIYHKAMGMILERKYLSQQTCYLIVTLTWNVGGSLRKAVTNRICHLLCGRFYSALPPHHRRHDG